MNYYFSNYIDSFLDKVNTYATKLKGGGDRPNNRNHVRTTIGCFLFNGKKTYENFGSTIFYLNYKTCDYI